MEKSTQQLINSDFAERESEILSLEDHDRELETVLERNADCTLKNSFRCFDAK